MRGLLWRLGSTGTVRKYREAAAAYRNVPCSSAYDSVDPSVPSGVVFAFAGMIVEMLVGSHVKSYGPPNVPWIPSKVAIVKDPVVLSSPGLPSFTVRPVYTPDPSQVVAEFTQMWPAPSRGGEVCS